MKIMVDRSRSTPGVNSLMRVGDVGSLNFDIWSGVLYAFAAYGALSISSSTRGFATIGAIVGAGVGLFGSSTFGV